MARKPVTACIGDGMVVRRIMMRACDVVFFKGIVEASEGLASVFAEHGGELIVAAPDGRASELDGLLEDLARELRTEPVPQNRSPTGEAPRSSAARAAGDRE